MKVKELMKTPVATCQTDTNLCVAAELMWRNNCGFLPIVNEQGKVLGIVTDRDMFIALGTRNTLPANLTVREVATGTVYSCGADEDISAALELMRELKVHRLPVLDAARKLVGILSIGDLIQQAEKPHAGKFATVSFEDVIKTLQRIYGPQCRHVVQHRHAAA
jgi:CBS domain-containing protein